MTGLKRVFMVFLCMLIVMVLFPDFDNSGWMFAGAIFLVWLGIILIMSVVNSIFGLYRYGGINSFLSLILMLGVIASMLWYLPQEDKVSPINKLKHGQFPTGADIQRGIHRFTFNFDFNHRNPRRGENFVNQQQSPTAKEAAQKEAEEQAKKRRRPKATLEITLDD